MTDYELGSEQIRHMNAEEKDRKIQQHLRQYEHVNDQLRAGQMRYPYFLLAVAASAIAFSVSQTEGAAASLWHVPLAAAIVCWLMSFFFGCRHLWYTNWALTKNVVMLQVESGMFPGSQGLSNDHRKEIVGKLRKEVNEKSNVAGKFVEWQFWLLVCGAILFLGWHTSGMIRRAVIERETSTALPTMVEGAEPAASFNLQVQQHKTSVERGAE